MILEHKAGPLASELDRPKPACAVCSDDYAHRTGIKPCRVLVESATVVRDVATGAYRVIARCRHGNKGLDVDVVELRDNPDELAVSQAVAFKKR